jgi:branched-chain amino acid transport system permease protein
VFNPFIGFQTVLIALIGGAATLWGPLVAAIVFSLLAETLRLQVPQLYMMALGLLLIVCVLYLPGGLASLRWATLRQWRDGVRNRGRDALAAMSREGVRERWRRFVQHRRRRRERDQLRRQSRAAASPRGAA